MGFVYGHGRDSKYRPIWVINASIYKANADKYSANDWIYSLVYFLEYMLDNTLISGQVENWNLICDMANISVFGVPKDFNTLMNVLQSNYRCRLFTMFIMNVSTGVWLIWKMIKNMLDPNTEKKIKVLAKNDFSEIYKHINREQVEEKFGGTARNVSSHYFPHIIPSNNFLMEDQRKEDILIGEDEYREMLKTNKFLVPSPFIKQDEEASRYDDVKSNSNTHKRSRSLRSERSIYTECYELSEELGNNVEIYLEKEDQGGHNRKKTAAKSISEEKVSISTASILKPREKTFEFEQQHLPKTKGSTKKKVTIIQTKFETNTRQSCCSENSFCQII